VTGQPARQYYGVTLAVLAVSALSYALLQTMVAPALPAIQHQLDASTTSVTWVLTVYADELGFTIAFALSAAAIVLSLLAATRIPGRVPELAVVTRA
jgi:predicted MFS family arabinose efflux permease